MCKILGHAWIARSLAFSVGLGSELWGQLFVAAAAASRIIEWQADWKGRRGELADKNGHRHNLISSWRRCIGDYRPSLRPRSEQAAKQQIRDKTKVGLGGFVELNLISFIDMDCHMSNLSFSSHCQNIEMLPSLVVLVPFTASPKLFLPILFIVFAFRQKNPQSLLHLFRKTEGQLQPSVHGPRRQSWWGGPRVKIYDPLANEVSELMRLREWRRQSSNSNRARGLRKVLRLQLLCSTNL